MRRAHLACSTVLLAAILPVSAGGQSSRDLPGAIVGRIRAVPVAGRIDYVVKAAIRPLPLVWISRDYVGTGQLTHRRGTNGQTAYEFIVGSDPARAPRHINRWGYLGEEVVGSGGSVVGLMKQSDEQSLSDVNASMARQAQERRFPFRVYAGAIDAGRAHLGGTTVTAGQDFTRWGFEGLLNMVAHTSVPLTGSTLPTGTRTGLLSTISELLQESSAARRMTRPDPIRHRRVTYVFNNTTYQLYVSSTELLRSATVGGRRFERVVHAELEGTQPGTDKRMYFEVWFPTTGPFAGLPVRVRVQPRWWFRFELTMVTAAP